ncbi:MAG: glycosyltransferase [Sporichthyaceae bacterium]
MTPWTPTFVHLRRLTDAGGLYEHARGSSPRPEHGYCLDDVARALVVVCRDRENPGDLADLRAQYLAFVLAAQAPDGRFRNRRAVDLTWSGSPGVEDCWGRALWALGSVVARRDAQHDVALEAFRRGSVWRSPWLRATSFAALGAAQVLAAHPGDAPAREVLTATRDRLRLPEARAAWPWPEERLTYANAVVTEAMLVTGHALADDALLADGLRLLDWLLRIQTRGEVLSVIPVAGWGPGEPGPPAFDQQPIEVAALADACACAFRLTRDPRWLHGVELCARWFGGENDSATRLYDVETAGGYDGLERAGRNDNQGAESTLALLSTLQQFQFTRLVRR